MPGCMAGTVANSSLLIKVSTLLKQHSGQFWDKNKIGTLGSNGENKVSDIK